MFSLRKMKGVGQQEEMSQDLPPPLSGSDQLLTNCTLFKRHAIGRLLPHTLKESLLLGYQAFKSSLVTRPEEQ